MGATISAATGEVIVTFDRLLRPGVTAPANWTVKADRGPGPLTHTTQAPVVIAGHTVTFPTIPGGMAFPPMGVTYLAAPPDVAARRPPHLTATAFVDLPIVTI